MKVSSLLAFVLYFNETTREKNKFKEIDGKIIKIENSKDESSDKVRIARRETNIGKLSLKKGLYQHFCASVFVMLHNSSVDVNLKLLDKFKYLIDGEQLKSLLTNRDTVINVKDIKDYFTYNNISKTELGKIDIESKPLFYCLFMLTS